MPQASLATFLLTIAAIARLATAAPPSAPAAPAPQSPEIALQRTLDQPITLDLQKVELSEAFTQIAAAAKISLQVDPACYDLLPYGSTTRVSASFRQSRLRDALEEVLIPLGLQQTVSGAGAGGSVVIIRPSDPLAHIGRRAEWEELKLLQDLRTSPDLTAPPPSPNAPGFAAPPGSPAPPPVASPFNLTDAIRTALDGRKDLIVSIPPDAPNVPAALDQVRAQLPLSAYRALELFCQLTHQVWFVEAGPLNGGPTGGNIRIMSPKQWIERQLERPIQISHTNEPLETIVADLTHASGIRFVPEPGLYQAVPPLSLLSKNGSVRQTLEALAGSTSIAFDVRDDSILLRLTSGPGNQPAKGDPVVGHITVPASPSGPQIDLYLRESDLPPALNELRKKQLQESIDALQKSWAHPASPPVPQPSAQQPLPPRPPAMPPIPSPTVSAATLPATQPTSQPEGAK